MTMVNPRSCKETPNGNIECNGALKLLQENSVDVHTYPIPIKLFDPVPSVVDVIETGFEILQAIWSLFPANSNFYTKDVIKSMTGTVEISSPISSLILLFILIN